LATIGDYEWVEVWWSFTEQFMVFEQLAQRNRKPAKPLEG
jgi:hypothetical protein